MILPQEYRNYNFNHCIDFICDYETNVLNDIVNNLSDNLIQKVDTRNSNKIIELLDKISNSPKHDEIYNMFYKFRKYVILNDIEDEIIYLPKCYILKILYLKDILFKCELPLQFKKWWNKFDSLIEVKGL